MSKAWLLVVGLLVAGSARAAEPLEGLIKTALKDNTTTEQL
jgi:hypothetical protein